ncbi:hypothetical protein [Paenibacillus sp. IHBB 3054]|uniref:hypothetical protein n=1 Tax=Paenibacillus sp. IHBB 3054 TaxID=3425689 RepID=UPI003F665478
MEHISARYPQLADIGRVYFLGVYPELMYITGNKLAYFADVSRLIRIIRKSMPRAMHYEFLFWAVTYLIQLIHHVERHEKKLSASPWINKIGTFALRTCFSADASLKKYPAFSRAKKGL